MTTNPYDAPKSQVEIPDIEPSVPDEVLKRIKNAWIAGTISGSMTLVVTLFAIMGKSILGFTAWELIDVAFIFGLTFGIYKKSRACAVLMLLYFIGAKILIIVETGKPSGVIMGLIFTYYFWLGVTGTYEYHKLLRAQKSLVGSGV